MRKEGPYFAIQERPRLVRAAVTDADFRFLSGGDEPRGWPPYRPSSGRFFSAIWVATRSYPSQKREGIPARFRMGGFFYFNKKHKEI